MSEILIRNYEGCNPWDITIFKVFRDWMNSTPDHLIEVTQDNTELFTRVLGKPNFVYEVSKNKSYNTWQVKLEDRTLYVFSAPKAGSSFELNDGKPEDIQFIAEKVIPYLENLLSKRKDETYTLDSSSDSKPNNDVASKLPKGPTTV